MRSPRWREAARGAHGKSCRLPLPAPARTLADACAVAHSLFEFFVQLEDLGFSPASSQGRAQDGVQARA